MPSGYWVVRGGIALTLLGSHPDERSCVLGAMMEEPQLLLGLEKGGPSLRVDSSQSSGLVSPLRKESGGRNTGKCWGKKNGVCRAGRGDHTGAVFLSRTLTSPELSFRMCPPKGGWPVGLWLRSPAPKEANVLSPVPPLGSSVAQASGFNHNLCFLNCETGTSLAPASQSCWDQ